MIDKSDDKYSERLMSNNTHNAEEPQIYQIYNDDDDYDDDNMLADFKVPDSILNSALMEPLEVKEPDQIYQ